METSLSSMTFMEICLESIKYSEISSISQIFFLMHKTTKKILKNLGKSKLNEKSIFTANQSNRQF